MARNDAPAAPRRRVKTGTGAWELLSRVAKEDAPRSVFLEVGEGGRLVDHPTVKPLKDGQMTGPVNSFGLLSLLGDAEATGGAHGLDLGGGEAEEAAAGAEEAA